MEKFLGFLGFNISKTINNVIKTIEKNRIEKENKIRLNKNLKKFKKIKEEIDVHEKNIIKGAEIVYFCYKSIFEENQEISEIKKDISNLKDTDLLKKTIYIEIETGRKEGSIEITIFKKEEDIEIKNLYSNLTNKYLKYLLQDVKNIDLLLIRLKFNQKKN